MRKITYYDIQRGENDGITIDLYEGNTFVDTIDLTKDLTNSLIRECGSLMANPSDNPNIITSKTAKNIAISSYPFDEETLSALKKIDKIVIDQARKGKGEAYISSKDVPELDGSKWSSIVGYLRLIGYSVKERTANDILIKFI